MTQTDVPCDGCRCVVARDAIVLQGAEGHEARYCVPCDEIYRAWVAVCFARELALNRMLECFIDETRARVPLAFVPQDLTKRETPLAVLG